MVTKTQSALESAKQMGVIQRYVIRPSGYVKQRYTQAPMTIKVGLVGFGAMAAIPLGCFFGFMSLVTLGFLIIAGIAFAIVEGGFAMFGSVFLLPVLGVALLVTCGVGLVSLVAYVCYVMAYSVLSLFWRQGDVREVQRQGRDAKQKAIDAGQRINT
ncbi:hypothetical protein FBU30_009726 [Linnemannia zychae]|nr:hypothetical protein FBU30_009726 [Linnemannia zychae]